MLNKTTINRFPMLSALVVGFGLGLIVPRESESALNDRDDVLVVAGHDSHSPRAELAKLSPELEKLQHDSALFAPGMKTPGSKQQSARSASPPSVDDESSAAKVTAAGTDDPRLSSEEIGARALGYTTFVRAGKNYGAGVVLDSRGYVLTCQHVLEGAKSATVSLSDGRTFDAELIADDSSLDIALIKLKGAPALRAAPVGSISALKIGEEVYAMGAPRKLKFSLSRGIVSYVGRGFGDIYYLQTDLATNGGNSGGPIVNDRGQVVAVSSFILRNSQGLAFALPIDYAFKRFKRWLAKGPEEAAFSAWLAARSRPKPASPLAGVTTKASH